MVLNYILIFFLLNLGVLLPVTADRHAYTVAGKPFTLSCPDVTTNQNPGNVLWKHNGIDIIKYIKGKPWKVNTSNNNFKGTENGNFSLEMSEAKEGCYTCVFSEKETNIHVQFLKVTGSPEGYLLQGESLELQLHPDNLEQTAIEWIGPHDARGSQPRWDLTDNRQRLQIKELQVQDDGVWKCSVHGHVIPYKVTVIGFLSASDEIFAAVNSTVTLSYALNFNIMEDLPTGNTSGKLVFLNTSGFCDLKKISNVQFKDAGWYPCSFRFNRRKLTKTVHLVVMEVFAMPPGPLFKEGEVKLCCNISAPLPPGSLLHWDTRNESKVTPHCLMVSTPGLRTCSLIMEGRLKISVNYTIEKATLQTRFPLTDVAVGAGVPLLLLILLSGCFSIYVAMKRKKQRAERMAQAKQHLLAKRTCQCQREQSNDYYHT